MSQLPTGPRQNHGAHRELAHRPGSPRQQVDALKGPPLDGHSPQPLSAALTTRIAALNTSGPEPRRPVIRKLLRALLKSDADLNAFCQDYFPDAHCRFARGMDRLSKVNLLLELSEPAQVLDRLREYVKGDPEAVVTIGNHLAERNTEAAQHAWALREKLEDLYLLREQRRLQGQDLTDLNSQIVAVKRIQRQAPQLQEGEILGDRYRLLEAVGRGGFGCVWQAFDRHAHRLVALKVLHREQGEDGRRIERFVRGAHQMSALTHPGIVRVLDEPAEYNGFHYFVMEYLPGGDLSQAVTEGTIDGIQALRAIVAVGAALQHAHERHLIHRDVKPQNILLDGLGGARLTDFDLVWAADTTGGTRTGFLGTHLYAAPEQAEDAKSVDARADTYALAMTTLFVLFGRALPQQAMYQRALFIDGLHCGEPAKALLRQATAIDPDDRPASIASFCSELARVLRIPIAWEPSHFPFSDRNTPRVLSGPSESTIVDQVGFQIPVDAPASVKQGRYRLLAVVSLAVGVFLFIGGARRTYRWLNPPPVVDPEADAARLLVDIDGDMAKQRWMEARAKANRLSKNPAVAPKTRDNATNRFSRAELESKVQPIYDRLLAAAENYDLSIKLYSEIPTASSYHQSARAVYEKIFPRFVENHLKAAEYARVVGMCEEFRSEVKVVLDVEPNHIKALNVKEMPCGQYPRRSLPGPDGGLTLVKPPLVAAPAPILAQAAQTLTMAQTEFGKGNFSKAIGLARSVQHIKPMRAWRIIGASACNIKDIKLARESLKHLDETDGPYVIHACKTRSITNIQGTNF